MKTVTRAVVVVTVAALACAGCVNAPEEAPETTGGQTTAPTVDFTACMVSDEGGWDDASFNESGYEGLTRAKDELGVQIKDVESTDPDQYRANVGSMVQEDCDLVIGVGFALEDAIQTAAEANPGTDFALVDSSFTDDEFRPVVLKNAKPLLFNTQEVAFLAGYLAAGVSETGKVATYGGMAYPSVTIVMDGFSDGVARYNNDHYRAVEVLGWDKATQTGAMVGNFTGTDAGRGMTEQFIDAGADVILPVAGPVALGSLTAASQADGVAVIWVDFDGYLSPANADDKGLILTSVMKLVGDSVFDTIAAAVEGDFTADPYIGTLKNGGVDLAPLHDFDATVDPELVAAVDDLKEQIISGELVVDSPSANTTQ